MAFVAAYSTITGVKHRVPEAWLGHPVLGRNLRKTPLTEAQEHQDLSPFDPFTVDQLKEYAAEHGVDVTGITRKADLIAAITTHPTTESAHDAEKE
jgi:hypothetical protein